MIDWQDEKEALEKVKDKDRVLLIGVYMESKSAASEHLQELSLLAETLGVFPVASFRCPIRKFDVKTLITKGKLEDALEIARLSRANLVIFDDEISPAQQRNLEKAFGLTVMDRTELILEVFAQRASSREAKLQVELARVKYQFPRLKRLWTHLSRQAATGGAGAYLKGEGEKQIEIDRRLLQRRVDQLKRELVEVKKNRETQRHARVRGDLPVFALVGYTNAGKSTLMNQLTEAGVFVEDKLFATLDTTTRKYQLPGNQEVLLIDTVGFIRKLPHLLVAAFRSTLEEVLETDALIHVVDVSSPHALEHVNATMEVLKELGAEKKPILTVFNKVDACKDRKMINRLRLQISRTVQMSAKTGQGIDDLLRLVTDELGRRRPRLRLRIPQKQYGLVRELRRVGNVIAEEYDGNDVLLEVELPMEWAGRVRGFVERCGS